MKFTMVLVTFLAVNSFAKKHHEHSAHTHGAGTLSIAFDKAQGLVEFKVSAESILGFEHAARSKPELEKKKQAELRFENEIAKMVQFDPKLNCRIDKKAVEHKISGEHSDWLASYSVACDQSPIGSKLIIDFSRLKSIQDLDIAVIADDLQKSAEFKKNPVVIELKK